MILIRSTTISSGSLHWNSRFWNVPSSVYASECLRCLWRLSPLIVPNYCEPRGRSYQSSTSGPFSSQSKIPSDNTVHNEEILSRLRQTPPANYRRPSPYGFHGLIDLEWPPSESVVLPPSRDCHPSTHVKRFAMSCAMLSYNDQQAGAWMSFTSPPFPTVLTHLSDDQ